MTKENEPTVESPGRSNDGNRPSLPKSPGRSWRSWWSALPGRRRDYFFLGLAAADILLMLLAGTYQPVFQRLGWDVGQILLIIDQLVVALWAVYLLIRLRQAGPEQRVAFLKTHWYEIVGLLPLGPIARSFLLLRGAKFAIAFYKLGRADAGDVAGMITRDLTFRFRDVIVDAIADAVFLQSLRRVREVMLRLDYSELAREAFGNHQEELRLVVNAAVKEKSTVGKISKLPFMGEFGEIIGDELSGVIQEVLETEAAGKIMKEITRGILEEMAGEVQKLDVERLTRAPGTASKEVEAEADPSAPQES